MKLRHIPAALLLLTLPTLALAEDIYWDCSVSMQSGRAKFSATGAGDAKREIAAASRTQAEAIAGSQFTVNHCNWGSCRDKVVCSDAGRNSGEENGQECELYIWKVQCKRQ